MRTIQSVTYVDGTRHATKSIGQLCSKELTVGFERGGKYNQLIRYQYKDNMCDYLGSLMVFLTHIRGCLECRWSQRRCPFRCCFARVDRADRLSRVRCSCRLSSSFVRNSIKIYLSGRGPWAQQQQCCSLARRRSRNSSRISHDYCLSSTGRWRLRVFLDRR